LNLALDEHLQQNRVFGSLTISFCIAGLTFCLLSPPLTWVTQQFVNDPFKLVLLATAPLVWYFRPQKQSLQWHNVRFSKWPVLLFWLLITAYLANENVLGVRIFSAALSIGILYALLGTAVPATQWKALFFPCCLLILLLPFEGYLDIYLGFPLRLLCAEWAGQVLQILGFNSMTNESIIFIENNAANVDLDCSGIKGLWAGAVFFVLLSVIERHRLSRRWFTIAALFVASLLLSNVLRIVLLILITQTPDIAFLADTFHLSLGLIGFSFSCVLAWALLRLTREAQPSIKTPYNKTNTPNLTTSGLFVLGLLVALWLQQPYQAINLPQQSSLQLPRSLNSTTEAPTIFEQDFFTRNQATVNKFRFNAEDLSASVLVVSSRYWKAQHEPHNCYIAQGYDLGFEGIWLLNNNSAVHFMQVDGKQKTATYWFQSSKHITPDYSARVLDGIFHPQRDWLMVSILWNRSVNQQQIEKRLLLIQESLHKQLTKETNNE
jgi:exosortase O